ncbi:flagellar hook-associated protein FlgK [Desulfococcus sp.]|uniref:flagellar hook-associated protein FlgK n=1 Tax=Desulfococcus sp. TaxID=2025834 RepID=UPI0035948836
MPAIGNILEIGRSALLTYQQGVNLTSHNIANVNTPGYSRQRLNLETAVVYNTDSGTVGSGVTATGIDRVYDRFITGQINRENQNLGNWEAREAVLGRVEILLNEASGAGLGQSMSEFWNGWQDLSNMPDGMTERTVLIGRGQAMSAYFRNTRESLDDIERDITGSIGDTVDEISALAQRVADLNGKISQIEMGGGTAHEFRDQRDLALKDLSKLADIRTFEKDDGMVSVSIGADGKPLVIDTVVPGDGKPLNLDAATGGIVDAAGNPVAIGGGKLKGLIDTRDTDLKGYIADLEDLAQTLMERVNTLHRDGTGLDGIGGRDFFTGTSAADMDVHPDLVDDISRIAAAGPGEALPGGNGNALAMADLQNSLVMNDGRSTFDEYYSALVGAVGSASRSASQGALHQSEMMTQLETYRESISGVSLDEEMINLIQFQNAYQAAAKLITVADELLDTVINML